MSKNGKKPSLDIGIPRKNIKNEECEHHFDIENIPYRTEFQTKKEERQEMINDLVREYNQTKQSKRNKRKSKKESLYHSQGGRKQQLHRYIFGRARTNGGPKKSRSILKRMGDLTN
jgi:hypothetical protein